MIALNTIRLWQSKRKPLSHVSAYFWQHATINCHHILKLEKELIQRIRFFFPKDYFSFKMCLSSLWYKIFHNDYYFIKRKIYVKIFRCAMLQLQNISFDLLILICLPIRDLDGKGFKRSPASPSRYMFFKKDQSWLSFHFQKYSLMNF